MPLVRYFVFVGGMLLGLLFLADWYFPASTAATAIADNDVDRSIIRIHSSHKWPAAIQMDTRAPMPRRLLQSSPRPPRPPRPLSA